MARVTPQEFAEKYARRTKAAVQDYVTGVQRVQQAPGQAAAAKQDKLLQNFQARVSDGTWRNRVSAVSLQDWQDAAITKGQSRISAGVDAAASKVQDFATQFLPAVDAARARVRQLPDLTTEDRINRSAAFQREMAKFRKR